MRVRQIESATETELELVKPLRPRALLTELRATRCSERFGALMVKNVRWKSGEGEALLNWVALLWGAPGVGG